MTRAEILQHVTKTLVELFQVDAAKVTPEARLGEDLDLDSIDAIDMAVKVQELTGKRVEEAALRKVRTVGDVVDLVESILREKSALGG